jgi:DNA polymerase sigma
LRREHRAELREGATVDYDSCNNNFNNFVEVLRQDEFVPAVGTIYTVRNVELFFQIVVANKCTILPKSARKFIYAIEYHSRRAEPPAETTAFRTEAIFEAMAIQEERRKLHGQNDQTYTAAQDPHSKRRTDVLSVTEIRSILREIIGRPNWKDMLTSWTVREQSMLRTVSIRVL